MSALASKQEFMEVLRKNGYKVTPQRIAIFEYLHGNIHHPTAEQIYADLKKSHPSMSLTTVYQTLHLFKELQLVEELGFLDKSSRFDPNTVPHVNIICPVCGTIRDYNTDTVRSLLDEITTIFNESPRAHRFEVYFLCDECKKNQGVQ